MKIQRYTHEWEDRIISRVLEHQEESDGYTELDQDPAWVRHILKVSNPILFMATEGESLLGFIWLGLINHWFSPDIGAGDLIFTVDPAHRGGKAAKLLRQRAEEEAKALGCVYLNLSTAFLKERDDRTLKYYQRYGYRHRGSIVYKLLEEP